MTTRNLLFPALAFSFASKGMGGIWVCTNDDIIIKQHRTGEAVQGKPEESSVMALNACPCFQENVTLDCTGFHKVKFIEPFVAIRGNQCLLVNGSGLSALLRH